MMYTLRHITTLWSARREPECDRLLTTVVWRALLGILSLWIVGAAGFGMYLSLGDASVGVDLGNGAEQSVVVSKEQLTNVAALYEERKSAHEAILGGESRGW